MIFRFLTSCLMAVLALPGFAQESVDRVDSPVAVEELLSVQRFQLEQGFEFDWAADRRHVQSGSLVVIKVDPALTVPRNVQERVLYAGDTTVQRLNTGSGSGVVIGLIPGEIDLTASPLWFGAPGLPESVTDEVIKRERSRAEEANIQPLNPDMIKQAEVDALDATDFAELLRTHVADLVLQYAPEERTLAESWRLPVVSAPQQDRP